MCGLYIIAPIFGYNIHAINVLKYSLKYLMDNEFRF